jgi:peptidoglycan/xylan/chitin deacetylase (PgdA/CDA1 family)
MSKESKPLQFSKTHLILWSSVTLTFCAIAFAAWIFREYELLKIENTALQNNRSMLLTQLSSVHEIESEQSLFEKVPEPGTIDSEKIAVIKSAKAYKPVFKPLPPLPGNTFSFNNGSVDVPIVSFTFDGGSSANAAIDIIDTLHSRNVKSTMFVTGQFIKKHPDIIRKLIDEGHELGNHMYSHLHLTTYSDNHQQTTLAPITHEIVCNELVKADNLLVSITGHHFAPLWRAPYGEFNEKLCIWARDAGYVHVGWRQGKTWSDGFDTNDWIPDSETPGFRTPDEVFTKIVTLANTKPYGINGGIILMHLGSERKNRNEQVYCKLGAMIDTLRVLGYEIVPVSEMMRRAGVEVNVARTDIKDPPNGQIIEENR